MDYRKADVLEDEGTRREIGQALQREGLSILLCDDGDKRREVNLYAPALKPGDILLAHDYAPDRAYFEEHQQGRIWSFHELEAADIAEVCRTCDLQPFLEEVFLRAAWVCMRRRH